MIAIGEHPGAGESIIFSNEATGAAKKSEEVLTDPFNRSDLLVVVVLSN